MRVEKRRRGEERDRVSLISSVYVCEHCAGKDKISSFWSPVIITGGPE